MKHTQLTKCTSQSRCIYGFFSSPLNFSTDLSYRYSLAVGVSLWRSDGSCSSFTLKATPGRACSTLQGCANTHIITFPISATVSQTAAQPCLSAQSHPSGSHHLTPPSTFQIYPICTSMSESCTRVSATTASKTGQLTVRTACWMRS